jgi:hypothetical protein
MRRQRPFSVTTGTEGDAGLIAPLARLTGKVTLITGAAGAITPVG